MEDDNWGYSSSLSYSWLPVHHNVKNFSARCFLPLHYSALYQAGNRTGGPRAEPSETVGHGLSPLRPWAKIPFPSFQFFCSDILSQQEKANSAVFCFVLFLP